MIQQRSSNRRWCPGCCRVVEMVRFTLAAALAGVSPDVLLECALTEPWHLTEGQDGTLMICLDSLLKVQAGTTILSKVSKRSEEV